LHQTLKFILRQPGVHKDERQPLERLERDYEKQSHVIAKAVARRGLHAALNDFFHAMF
jgi:hypothetical protein